MLIDRGNPYASAPPAVLKLAMDDFRFELSANNQLALGRTANWTVLAYLAADCNLARLMFDNLLEMKSVGSNDEVHVLALFDGPLLTDSFIARLHADTQLGEDLVMRFNELRTKQPETLTLALQIANAFPSRHRLVIVSGHGGGWRGVMVDEDAGMRYRREPGRLELPGPGAECDALLQKCQRSAEDQINRVIEQQAGQPPQPLDILALDACHMGNIEALACFQDMTQLLVVSEDAMPGEGLDYQSIIRTLRDNSNIEPAALAGLLVDTTARFYRASPLRPRQVTLAALASKKLKPLAEAFVFLVRALDLREADISAAVHRAMETAWRSPSTGAIDLRGLVQQLLTGTLPPAVATAASAVLDRFDELVIASCSSDAADGPNGLSIYAPLPEEFDPAYLRSANELPYGLGIWAWFLGAYYVEKLGTQATAHPLIQVLEQTMRSLNARGA